MIALSICEIKKLKNIFQIDEFFQCKNLMFEFINSWIMDWRRKIERNQISIGFKNWKLIEKETKGFIYYVSRTGTTGVSDKLSEGLLGKLKEVRKVVKKPLIVGFGLSNSEQVKTLAPYCDGIVVGSAIVREIEIAKNFKEARKNTYSLINKLKEALI